MKFIIRRATINDLSCITDLFRSTIELINSRDYSNEQVTIWTSVGADADAWSKRIQEQYFILGELSETIVGFASLAHDGYFDTLYVHKDYQRQGVATQLVKAIEEKAKELKLKTIYSDVSITAKPFFERHGYNIVTEQKRLFKGVEFLNYRMTKEL